MKHNENAKHWFYLILLTMFIVILFLTVISFQYTTDSKQIPFYMIFFVEYHTFFMFFIAIFGVIFGSVTQLMNSRKTEINNKKLNILKKQFRKSISKDEKKILDYLIQNNGISTQYELTKLENLNKLKVSRILVDMENKGLLTKKKIGKINKLFLDKDLFEIYSRN